MSLMSVALVTRMRRRARVMRGREQRNHHRAYIHLPLGFEAIFSSHLYFAQLHICGESHGRLEHLDLAIYDRQYATRFDLVDLLAPQREQYSTCCITNLGGQEGGACAREMGWGGMYTHAFSILVRERDMEKGRDHL